MGKILEIDVDESIELPASCDSMPADLRGHLKAALTNACKLLKCKVDALRWSVKVYKKTGNPFIKVRKV